MFFFNSAHCLCQVSDVQRCSAVKFSPIGGGDHPTSTKAKWDKMVRGGTGMMPSVRQKCTNQNTPFVRLCFRRAVTLPHGGRIIVHSQMQPVVWHCHFPTLCKFLRVCCLMPFAHRLQNFERCLYCLVKSVPHHEQYSILHP